MKEVLCSDLRTTNIYQTIAVCQALGEKSFAWVIWNHSQLQKGKLRHRELGPASCSLLDVTSDSKPWQVWPQFSSVQSLSCVQLFATSWTTACQASLSITNSRSPPKPMSIELVMPSSHLIFFHFSSCPQSFPASGSFLFFFFFFFLLVVNFVIHWNETAMGLHVFPIPIPPPTSLSTRSL